MKNSDLDRALGSLMRLCFAVIVGCMAFAVSDAFGASPPEGEVTSGVTVRLNEGLNDGYNYELTWYSTDDNWRWGVGYITSQYAGTETYLACGKLGSYGSVCNDRTRPHKVEGYPYGYLQRVFRSRSGVYAALGAAMHPVRKPLLSTTATFRTSLGYQFNSTWSVEWSHMSNGSLRSPNWGQDVLLVRYSW